MTKKIQNIIQYSGLTALGFVIPVFFAAADLKIFSTSNTVTDLLHLVSEQRIYLFSSIVFPTVFNTLFFLHTQLKKSHDELLQDAQYFKSILNANPEGVIILNKWFQVIFCNDSFKYLFNSTEQILGHANIKSTIPKVSFFQKEYQLDSNLMNNHPFLVSFKQTIYNQEVNYYLSFKDLKEIKDNEKIIKNQSLQIVENNKLASLGEMASGIAHEINNPLTVISSNTALVSKLYELGKLDSEKIDSLNTKTLAQVVRITTIIKSLRSLSHGGANDKLESFSLQELLSEAVNLAKLKAKYKNIIFSLETAEHVAFGNRSQIVQVVLNLLNNAIDAIEKHEQPWIKILIKEEKNHLHVLIKDSGTGIEGHIAEKIFLPMYTTKPVGKGTGLGLSLSRSFMNQNMGDLSYEKIEGHTCFIVTVLKGVPEELDKAA